MQWGWARHGIRVVTMLAIALEDPEVRSPCAYFGAFATKPAGGVPDLRLNLARILKQKGESRRPRSPRRRGRRPCSRRSPHWRR